ncbi:ATP-dependent RNA helicase DEAH11, chloroplastic isoform A [Senna tora]|uniref:RBR-type E3 ubiquitin transferase n=1 Tax=Senna tora TaxID=362788 RepID=A0A834WNI6_9FABA|nr:ATP-dependent RNA helicase DEAH11, chloroplastic isoform A [Senna tora]
MDASDDFQSLLREQRRELTEAEAMDSDFDFAFRLQLQEALAASLAFQPSSSSSSSSSVEPQLSPSHDAVFKPTTLLSEELARVEQEINDRKQSEIEIRKMKDDLSRRMHDQNVAREILRIPEADWMEWGDSFEKPFDEGCSKREVLKSDGDTVFRLYFKGWVSEERHMDEKVVLAGIGIAICDPRDNLIFEMSKPMVGNGMNKIATQIKALIEGLNAALALDLKRLTYYCDYFTLFQFLTRRWPPKQAKIAMLVNQVTLLQRKFTCCNAQLVPRNDVKFAFKLAKDAISSQITKCAESSSIKNLNETCVICLEDTDVNNIFSVDGCQHRYCFTCMKQHVEVKLLHGMVPKCPHEKCNSELLVDSCRKFLTHKLIETMQQRIKEASIPVTDKIYCPYPRCSCLMSKTEVIDYSNSILRRPDESGPAKCLKCHKLFCISCRVPWHSAMTCSDYKRLNPNPPLDDLKLKSLASRSLWRQCVKCNHMIELAEGCYHMTCRCGYEFCYNCGAEWKNKKATCSCPLWEEDNIWMEDRDSDLEEEEEDDDDDDDDDYFDYESDIFEECKLDAVVEDSLYEMAVVEDSMEMAIVEDSESDLLNSFRKFVAFL